MTAEEFKAWRKERGWSQAEAAERLGLSVPTIANYERGRRLEDGRIVVIPKTVELACAHYRPLKTRLVWLMVEAATEGRQDVAEALDRAFRILCEGSQEDVIELRQGMPTRSDVLAFMREMDERAD